MACTKEELQERIRAVVVAGNGYAQYPVELRRDVMAYARPLIAGGQAQMSIAAELGMKGWTLNRWHQNERKRKLGGARFVEVAKARVVVAPAPASFEVTCPSGHEVRVPACFEVRALRELLAAVEGR